MNRAIRRIGYGTFYAVMLVLVVLTVLRAVRAKRAEEPFSSQILRTKTDPTDAAISPDGKHLALVHRETIGSVVNQVDVLDIASGRMESSLTLPQAKWGGGIGQYFISKSLSYCDQGKYLVAYDDLDTLYILETGKLRLHGSISLNGLRILLGDPRRKLETVLRSERVAFNCAQGGPLALIGFDVEAGGIVSLIDLDTASDLGDIAGTFNNFLDAVAISPSGTQVAITRSSPRSGPTRNVEILDSRSQKKTYETVLTLATPTDLELSFAGESALLVIEKGCPGNVCSEPPTPHGRTMTVWNFGEDGSLRKIGVDGAETYKWAGASSDGSLIYAYTGVEKYCRGCNSGAGELKIEDARFALWDRKTGLLLGRSPKLRVEDHPCPIQGWGCTAYQQSPELHLSDNGSAMLAFWPRGTVAPQEGAERLIEVFNRTRSSR